MSAAAQRKVDALVEYIYRDTNGRFWLDVVVDRRLWAHLGPYETEAQRDAVKADLLNMMRSFGARDMPAWPQ